MAAMLAVQSAIAVYDQVEPPPEMVTKEAADAACAGARRAAHRAPEAAAIARKLRRATRQLARNPGRHSHSSRNGVNGMGGRYAGDVNFGRTAGEICENTGFPAGRRRHTPSLRS